MTVGFSVGDLRLRKPLPVPRPGPSKQLFAALNFSTSCLNKTTPFQGFQILTTSRFVVSSPKSSHRKIVSPMTYLFHVKSQKRQISRSFYLNVFHPAGVSADAKLPVVVYIHRGGFTAEMLPCSMPPPSFLAPLNGFGFLAGKEVKEAGVANLGIHGCEWSVGGASFAHVFISFPSTEQMALA